MATRPTDRSRPWGEFELIDTLFAPLARGLAGAFDLKDDVATLSPKAGHELVVKTDSTIENVHFMPADPPDTVARKALRRTLSDFAAKGAEPEAYLLAIALPETMEKSWLEGFVEGLSKDQQQFRVALAGGETNRTPGALTITVTTIGWVPEGQVVRRNGAKAGDDVWVTGTIGDAAGGLSLLIGEAVCADEGMREYLIGRFRVPEPRLEFGGLLRGLAHAAIDVSDGLFGDLGHIAETSHVRIEIDSASVPVSRALRALWKMTDEGIARVVSAGDDYEIAFTAPPAAGSIKAAAARSGSPITRIGRIVEGVAGVVLRDAAGSEITVPRKGYRHF